MGRGWQTFSKEIAAADEAAAREKLLSTLGSQHGVERRYIEIAAVAAVPTEELRDPAVRYRVEGRGPAP